jgi:hypothetical protein
MSKKQITVKEIQKRGGLIALTVGVGLVLIPIENIISSFTFGGQLFIGIALILFSLYWFDFS